MAMASAITQINNANTNNGPSARRRKRTTIKPACLGITLLALYAIFVYLILITFEEAPIKNIGADLTNSVMNRMSRLTKRAVSGMMTSSEKQPTSVDKDTGKENPNQQTSKQSKPAVAVDPEHPDLVNFCGECIWRDTLFNCEGRVKWEVENKGISEFESKTANLLYCTKPQELHVSEFCGECKWKDMEFTCNERVAWEVENKKLPEIEAKKRNLAYCKRPPYILSPLCGGCVTALTNMTSKMYRYGVPCYDVMTRRVKAGKAESINDAAKMIGEEFEECKMCGENCWEEYFASKADVEGLDGSKKGYLTKYWRFDQAAPKIRSPTTLALPSISKNLRMPPSRFDDIEAYLTEKYNAFETSNDTKHVEIFIEYNPALAPIPPKMKKYLPKNAAYAVALRVTPANNCFRRDQMLELPQKVWDHTMMSATNMLGLALLDKNYAMLEGYDIVVDPAWQLGFAKDGYGTTYFGEPTFMDYRLFTLNGEIYLHANADVTVVTKLDIRSSKHSRNAKKDEFKLDIVYGESNLEVTMLHQFNTIWSGGDRGKNFALFAVPNSTHPDAPDSIYAEVEINPYHQVQQIYLDDIEMLKRKIVKKRIRRNWTVDKVMMRKVKDNGNLTTSEIEPTPSFHTVDEHWFPGIRPSFRKAGHGGACCVSLSREEVLEQGEHISLAHNSWGDNDYLLVGVAHTSVIWRRWYSDKNVPQKEKNMIPHTHYVSFFYAFEPRPPFNLRARSGYFCLGFAGEDGTEGGVYNPHSVLTKNRKLSQHNETFACPQIHFVSSFIEKVGDSASTVIGYGINDCTPRIVEVEKKEIARLLFSDPFEMKIESRSSQEMENISENLDEQKPISWG